MVFQYSERTMYHGFQSTHHVMVWINWHILITLLVQSVISIHAPIWVRLVPWWITTRQDHFNPCTRMGCDQPFTATAMRLIYFNPRTLYRARQHIPALLWSYRFSRLPISHSVLSGLDNRPLFKRERSRVWCATEVHHTKTSYYYYITVITGMQAKTDL